MVLELECRIEETILMQYLLNGKRDYILTSIESPGVEKVVLVFIRDFCIVRILFNHPLNSTARLLHE